MFKLIISIQIALFGFWFLISNVLIKHPKATLSDVTVCHSIPSEDMRLFALDPEFQALHPSPLKLDYEGLGQAITFKTADGADANGYLISSKKKSDQWLMVYQEWWGLNDFIRKQSDTYYKDLGENVNVLAVDLYDGKIATTPQEAGKLVSEAKEPRLESIINAAIGYVGKKAKIANVGWCFGGGWSLRSGLQGGKQTVGTVMYYGMPVKDVEKLKMLSGDVLGLFATETRISKEVIEEFAANMKLAGKSLEYKIFNGVHGFANPSNPKYDEALGKEAYDMSLAYLKKKF
ncbi:MAG: dienelactone hydrolase family protein [Saprospiraceae bacterium]